MIIRSKGGDPLIASDKCMDEASLAAQLSTKSNKRAYGIVQLWKSIHPLTTVASIMNTGAHPDDEHSDTLAYYSLGKGVHTISLIATRGEGGQNELGSELGDALGVIRTRELEEASKMMNVTLCLLSEQIHDPIYDFGFSKCAEETLAKWGDSLAYERLIRNIRTMRPDVVFNAFQNDVTTHGHHRAMTILTIRAFDDAANMEVFPEHAEAGIRPWQIKKMYVPAGEDAYHVFVPTGEFNEIYGASYVQMGEQSRFMHKTQGMGSHIDEGPISSYYELVRSIVPVQKQEQDFFDGIAFTFDDLAKEVEMKKGDKRVITDLYALHSDVQHIVSSFPRFSQVALEAQRMRIDVSNTISDIARSNLDDETKADIIHRLRVKEDQLNLLCSEALSFIARIRPESAELVPGQTTKVTLTAFNGGMMPLSDLSLKLRLPQGWVHKPLGETKFSRLGYNETVSVQYEVEVPMDTANFHPYHDPIFSGVAEYVAYHVTSHVVMHPAQTVAILPAYSICMSPEAVVLNTVNLPDCIPVKATIRNYKSGAAGANIYLQLPDGWTAQPAHQELEFGFKGETLTVSFKVQPTAEVRNGHYTISAVVEDSQFTCSERAQVIQYPHIGKTYYIHSAQLKIEAFDLRLPEQMQIGYISSGFDNIDHYLSLVGLNVTRLEPKDIEFGDLSVYDAIVLGIRAYAIRPELTSCNQRLLQYVHYGGNLVVQYHKPEDNWQPELAPYPIEIGKPFLKWRVTDENSQVTVLAPAHSMFHYPNLITNEDWKGWIQERSAYIPCSWGAEYTELISTGDPGEEEFTGIFLTAEYGKGVYSYSSLVWYREIPHLVPGAIRLFVNMISQARVSKTAVSTARL